ncbi:ABC transporter ATP-binding protein [Pararhodobacter zhoushanensis]|uniref:ABC transporter ATP-binding protein n=1 Tax=Pararhodobacter zhoushanensis TaxID=2479545 RepID=A0ABT3H1D3_9RHOB|nr:ABC transporter ATP-binding protein [Pararhodobacter zhoushanensis]MCW1933571.1 ABC transporter ATP-binding protein [Pararhodobacter zhoushanensis]
MTDTSRPEALLKPEALLSVEGISLTFGGITALDDISFRVAPRQICGIIGPNGAGKTSLFNVLSRIYSPSAGRIRFDGTDILSLPQHRMAALGIGRTFQNIALFPGMSVLENVLVGNQVRMRSGFVTAMLGLPRARRDEAAGRKAALETLERLGIAHQADTLVSQLNFGAQKRVEFARALVMQPKLLLLDEPAAGLNHEGVEDLRAFILTMRDAFGVSVLLVEHHLDLIMRVAEQVVAINFGRKIADGTPAQVQGSDAVVQAYLGAPDV